MFTKVRSFDTIMKSFLDAKNELYLYVEEQRKMADEAMKRSKIEADIAAACNNAEAKAWDTINHLETMLGN